MDFAQKPVLSAGIIGARCRSLAGETGFKDLEAMASRVEAEGVESIRDELSTRMMEVYRDTGSSQAFGLIYELNNRNFFIAVLGRLRRSHYLLDSNDILQEVFVNIYRYPHRFKADRPQAFRNWASTIIRNTVLRFLRGLNKDNRVELLLEDAVEPEDELTPSPSEKVIDAESGESCRRTWLVYLYLYLEEYNGLNTRERQALHLVEVEGFSYREVSAEMGIKVENLKMVIFRARRKVIRNMKKRLQIGAKGEREVASQ